MQILSSFSVYHMIYMKTLDLTFSTASVASFRILKIIKEEKSKFFM